MDYTHCSRCIQAGTPRKFVATVAGLDEHNAEWHSGKADKPKGTRKRKASDVEQAMKEAGEFFNATRA